MTGGGVQCYLLFVAARGSLGMKLRMYLTCIKEMLGTNRVCCYTASRDNIRYITLIVIRYKYVASLAQLRTS